MLVKFIVTSIKIHHLSESHFLDLKMKWIKLLPFWFVVYKIKCVLHINSNFLLFPEHYITSELLSIFKCEPFIRFWWKLGTFPQKNCVQNFMGWTCGPSDDVWNYPIPSFLNMFFSDHSVIYIFQYTSGHFLRSNSNMTPSSVFLSVTNWHEWPIH